MKRLPQRVSLVSQVADILRQDLRRGRWPKQLPGEHALSDLLEVSRSTLRAALDILRREGLIRAAQGRRRWLTPESRRRARPTEKVVGVVSSLAIEELSGQSIFVMDELRRHLQRSGYELEIHPLPPATQRNESSRLPLLVERTRAACWILASCTRELQAWFAHGRERTLVLGSCHEGIELPSFTLDYPAACRHAVGALHRLGHRRLALLPQRTPFAGIREIEESFRRSSRDGPSALVRHHDGSVDDLTRLLRGLMAGEARPTALIGIRAADAVTIFCHLLNHGFRIPADVSLLSIFDDSLLDRLTPSLARYTCNYNTYARRLARRVLQMAAMRSRPPSVRIVPEFRHGQTLGHAPR